MSPASCTKTLTIFVKRTILLLTGKPLNSDRLDRYNMEIPILGGGGRICFSNSSPYFLELEDVWCIVYYMYISVGYIECVPCTGLCQGLMRLCKVISLGSYINYSEKQP